jgi:hypothetical protein
VFITSPYWQEGAKKLSDGPGWREIRISNQPCCGPTAASVGHEVAVAAISMKSHSHAISVLRDSQQSPTFSIE